MHGDHTARALCHLCNSPWAQPLHPIYMVFLCAKVLNHKGWLPAHREQTAPCKHFYPQISLSWSFCTGFKVYTLREQFLLVCIALCKLSTHKMAHLELYILVLAQPFWVREEVKTRTCKTKFLETSRLAFGIAGFSSFTRFLLLDSQTIFSWLNCTVGIGLCTSSHPWTISMGPWLFSLIKKSYTPTCSNLECETPGSGWNMGCG